MEKLVSSGFEKILNLRFDFFRSMIPLSVLSSWIDYCCGQRVSVHRSARPSGRPSQFTIFAFLSSLKIEKFRFGFFSLGRPFFCWYTSKFVSFAFTKSLSFFSPCLFLLFLPSLWFPETFEMSYTACASTCDRSMRKEIGLPPHKTRSMRFERIHGLTGNKPSMAFNCQRGRRERSLPMVSRCDHNAVLSLSVSLVVA